MKYKDYWRYLKYATIIVTTFMLVIGISNVLVDPYSLYNSPKIDRFNSVKSEYGDHVRLIKTYAVKRIKPKAIVLGTSRALRGIDPEHKGWSYEPVYNLAILGANIYEIARYFQHAHGICPLKQVVLLLDFRFFDVYSIDTDLDESRLSVSYDGQENADIYITDYISTIYSYDAVSSSIKTFFHNFINRRPNTLIYQDNGFCDTRNLTVPDGYRAAFIEKERNYLRVLSQEKVRYYNPETGQNSFDYYRQILRIAYQDDIDLHIAISPNHARLREVYAVVGLWSQYEEWKHMLVKINEEEALLAGRSPFKLWDFSVYNEYTTEDVPSLEDKETEMEWHWEDSHFKKALGDKVLDCIFKQQASIQSNFGVLMSSKNITDHLHNVRIDRQNYRDTHLQDIVEIEELYNTYQSNPKG